MTMQFAHTAGNYSAVAAPAELADMPGGNDGFDFQSELTGEVAACLPIVRALCGQLTDTIRQVESSVVQACEGFQGIAARARQMVSETARHVNGEGAAGQPTDASFSGLVAVARQTLESLLGGITRSSAFAETMANRMSAVATRIDTIQESLRAMDAIAGRARVLALNAKIEAARLGERGATFKVLASETSDLSLKTGNTVTALRDIVHELSDSTIRAASELRERAAVDVSNAEISHRDGAGLLDRLASANRDMQGLMQRSHATSAELAGDVSKAVTALQFQDAVSQRVTHVVQTLEEIDTALVARLGGPESAVRLAQGRSTTGNEWVERMAGRYTMDAERGVIGERPGVPDNNVELF